MEQSLKSVMSMIGDSKIVLPAMQRPFVWKEDRITNLVDSLLRGFPLGMALLWRTRTPQRFRRFEKDVKPDTGITIDYDKASTGERYLVLDGQQRLTALYIALFGTYDSKRLYVDLLSGYRGEKDTSEAYWDCRFMTDADASKLNEWPKTDGAKSDRAVFVRFDEMTKVRGLEIRPFVKKRATDLGLDNDQTDRLDLAYYRGSLLLPDDKALQFHLIDEDGEVQTQTPIEEILEIFVRVNSAGLVLLKSDLLMSLLDIELNNIQQRIYEAVDQINTARPFEITRDDVLKSLLIAVGSDTRFANLIGRSGQLNALATGMDELVPIAREAWKTLEVILMDGCRINSGRFLRGHNSLLPFVTYLMEHPAPGPGERRRMVVGIYIVLMTGIFSSAEARMGSFARNKCRGVESFPLAELAQMVANHYGIDSLENLLSRYLDLTLNIAHGGITLDHNPDNLERDHIFPRATLTKQGVPNNLTNHYANFHFLRGKDNRNKSDTPPNVWFRKPGMQPAYSEAELKERLLTWELLEPGNFPKLLEARTAEITKRAVAMFGMDEAEIGALFKRS